MIPFVLLADRRSGTTLMIDYLNNTRRIHCWKRVFGIEKPTADERRRGQASRFYFYRTARPWRRIRYYLARGSLLAEFLDREVLVPREGRDIIGFRLTYDNALHYYQVLELIRRRRWRVIHLIRHNVLKTYISFHTARLHRLEHPRAGDRVRPVRLRVDVDDMLRELDRRSARIDTLRRAVAAVPHLEVGYEELSADPQGCAGRILPFLDAEPEPFRSDLVKINPDRLRDVVENYDEIAAALAGTPHARFLDP